MSRTLVNLINCKEGRKEKWEKGHEKSSNCTYLNMTRTNKEGLGIY